MPDYDLVKRLASSISDIRGTGDHHSAGMAVLAADLAKMTGLSDSQIELVEVGAYLHDIGKIMIRQELIKAARKLSEAEMIEMRRHTEFGWVIVDRANFEPMICEIVRHHHERYDGNGYPDRLQQQQIPLAARIVGVCDMYQSMISDRAYRKAFTPTFARNFMESEKGRAFDPQLLDLFFSKVLGRNGHTKA